MINISDPIRLEHAIAMHNKVQKEIKDITDRADTLIKKIENCDQRIEEKQ